MVHTRNDRQQIDPFQIESRRFIRLQSTLHSDQNISILWEQKPPFLSDDKVAKQNLVLTRGTMHKFRFDTQLLLEECGQTGRTFAIRPSDLAMANGHRIHGVQVWKV